MTYESAESSGPGRAKPGDPSPLAEARCAPPLAGPSDSFTASEIEATNGPPAPVVAPPRHGVTYPPDGLILRADPLVVARLTCAELSVLRTAMTLLAGGTTLAALTLRGAHWISRASALLLDGAAALALATAVGVVTWELVWRHRRAELERFSPRRSVAIPPMLVVMATAGDGRSVEPPTERIRPVPGELASGARSEQSERSRRPDLLRPVPGEYGVALGVMAAATGLCLVTRSALDLPDQSMIHLLGVLLVASRCSRGPSVTAALLAVLAIDFFFVPPFFTLAVAEPRHVVTFGVMLAVGLMVSGLTLRIRAQAAAQTTLALERATLAREAERTKLAMETERLRSSLLSSVSHDLRTPLASITGSADVLLDPQAALDERERRELLATIHDEAERLERLVTNVLDLTKLESGTLRVEKSWYPVEELFTSALERVQALLVDHPIHMDVPDEMMLVPVEPVLVEQVLINLLDNAAGYSEPGAPIELRARLVDGHAELEVLDRGRGIPAGQEDKVFEKFHRGPSADRRRGAGLGLTICQAIVRAHGGLIQALNRPDGGAAFRFTLPLDDAPPMPAPSAEAPLP